MTDIRHERHDRRTADAGRRRSQGCRSVRGRPRPCTAPRWLAWDAGDIRDAAEKAWCATKRAADGLIAARTGEEPETATDTTRGLRYLGMDDEEVRRSMGHYYVARETLHGCCFYRASCEIIEDTERLIHETLEYIDEAERMAAA